MWLIEVSVVKFSETIQKNGVLVLNTGGPAAI